MRPLHNEGRGRNKKTQPHKVGGKHAKLPWNATPLPKIKVYFTFIFIIMQFENETAWGSPDTAITFVYSFGGTYDIHNLQQLTPSESQLVNVMRLCIKRVLWIPPSVPFHQLAAGSPPCWLVIKPSERGRLNIGPDSGEPETRTAAEKAAWVKSKRRKS